jgi:chaperonin GroES
MIQPCGHRLVVKVRKVADQTEGGIYLPDQTKDRDQLAETEGELVAVGVNAWKGFDDGQPWACQGDTVLFRQYSGVVKEIGGEMYRVMNDEDVMGVVCRPVP